MKIFGKINLWKGLAATFGAIFILLVVLSATAAWPNAGMINSFLGVRTSKIVQKEGASQTDTAYFKSDYGDVNNLTMEDYAKLLEDEYKHAVAEQEEGSVLLKNNSDALPLKSSERKVSLFGFASRYPFYKALSGGTWDNNSSKLLTYEQAMKDAGFTINQTLFDSYTTGTAFSGGRGGDPADFGNTSYALGEKASGHYTAAIKNTFSQFGDAAIVMFARVGGETRDLPKSETDNSNGNLGNSHLALTPNERALMQLLKQEKDNGTFGKIIALINMGNAMELGWLDEFAVDAALWIGGPAQRGFEGVANILTGTANPSGRLVNIYAENSLSAPAVKNAGSQRFNNAAAVNSATKDAESATVYSLVYQEGIYIGYRYYETRYEDMIMNRWGANNAVGSVDGEAWNYAKEVVFPFGYGLSYTSFTQTLNSVSTTGDTVTANVTVKNTGSVKGKDVVQLYAQTPYGQYERENLVEKSAIQLAGFEKTKELAPGADQTLTVTVDKYLLASYDYKSLKGYYLSDGDYYFAIGNDSHDALNNVLKAKGASGMVDQKGTAVAGDAAKAYKWTLASRDTGSYILTPSDADGKASRLQVTNRFDEANINYWIPGAVTYLTRQNWNGTFPTATTTITATEAMITAIDGYTYVKPVDAPAASSFTQGLQAGITFVDMRGVAYDDPLWDDFLNQLTVKEMSLIMTDTGGTAEIPSIAKPQQINQDGPDGTKGYILGEAKNGYPICYSNQIILASSWNKELAKMRGYYMGEDALFSNVAQLWAPGINTHRTPFSGRNFEYYSEDPALSYLMGAVQVLEMEQKGINTSPKHFATNDQEAHRQGVSTFMNEQTVREIYFRAAEGAFTRGKASGTMTAYNRLGCTYFGQSIAAQQELLRGEWGMSGTIICDMTGSGENYQQSIEMLVAGNDQFCLAGNDYRAGLIEKAINSGEGDGYLLKKLRDTNKNFYYAMVNSNLINGLDSNSIVISVMPWWQVTLIALSVSLGVISLGCAAMFVLGTYVFKVKEAV